jgi:hypothetical protein
MSGNYCQANAIDAIKTKKNVVDFIRLSCPEIGLQSL